MISKESLAALAELYDFAHQNLNPNDPGINDAGICSKPNYVLNTTWLFQGGR
jgi:hypothetical protein